MQSKILIVEEQSKTTDKISAQLEENGYWTDICHSTDELFPRLRRVHMFS
jgi:DNA-binding response OmpR family regulator